MVIYKDYTLVYNQTGGVFDICASSLNRPLDSPIMERTPHIAHTIRLSPTDPVVDSTPFGETKMPEPTDQIHQCKSPGPRFTKNFKSILNRKHISGAKMRFTIL